MTTVEAEPTAVSRPDRTDAGRSGAPPGWYGDPAGCHQQRYWDGWRWTPGVADHGFVREDPLPEQGCAPVDGRARPPLRAAAIAVGGLVLGFVLSVVAIVAMHALAPHHRAWQMALSQAGLWTGMLGAVLLVSRRYGTGSIRRDFGVQVRGADIGWGLLLAFAARIVTGAVAALVLLAAGRLRGGGTGVGASALDTPRLVLMCLFLVVGAPLIEEIFFRGLLLRSLQTRLTSWVAVPVQALLFAAAHGLSSTGLGLITQLIGTFLFGLAAGIIVVQVRRLGPTMVGHALFNLVPAIALIVLST